MPQRMKYGSSKAREAAARRYFDGISRVKTVTEQVPTGEIDRYGHQVFREETVVNALGEPVRITEFVEPPTVGGLCAALGISRTTWMHYHSGKTQEAAEWIDDVLRTWNERELLTREGRNIQGIVFNLKNNYGYSDRPEDQAEESPEPAGVIILGEVLEDETGEGGGS